MKALRIAVGVVLVLGFTGCGADQKSTTTTNIVMPNVTGAQLDVALSDISRAGFDGDPEVLGGGTFGVVNESNWTVCDQLPAAGEAITATPRLTVDRSCPDEPSPPASTPTTIRSTTQTTTRVTTPVTTSTTVSTEVLNVQNSADLVALLAETDPGSASVAGFASKYQGRTIEFDGNIASVIPAGSRYFILIYAGNYSTTSVIGPSFQFKEVDTSDLHMSGPNTPYPIVAGTNLHIVAKVLGYNSTQQLLFLEPVSTTPR